MEMGFPKAETGDAKEQAFLQAMDVMSEYLTGYKDEAHEQIILKKSRTRTFLNSSFKPTCA